jgi:hypothetical protein
VRRPPKSFAQSRLTAVQNHRERHRRLLDKRVHQEPLPIRRDDVVGIASAAAHARLKERGPARAQAEAIGKPRQRVSAPAFAESALGVQDLRSGNVWQQPYSRCAS